MSVYNGVTFSTSATQGPATGTVSLSVSDMALIDRIDFLIVVEGSDRQVADPTTAPPDGSPGPWVFEKKVLLDPTNPTSVTPRAYFRDGTTFEADPASLGPMVLGGGALEVQDGAAGAVQTATRLVFPAGVSDVPTGSETVTLDLNGHYAALVHRHPWSDLDGVPAFASRWPAFSDVTGALALSQIGATGTKDVTTFLRGDGAWMVPAYPVTSVAGRTGDVVLDPVDIGQIDWTQITNPPDFATRWPTLAEIGAAGGSGFTINQNLRTTDSPTFVDLTLSGRITVGSFINAANVGDARIGRGSDRQQGTLTFQLGGSTGRTWEFVDSAWTKVIASISGEAPAGSFFVSPLGRVGIGTSLPGEALHVKGRIAVEPADSSADNTGYIKPAGAFGALQLQTNDGAGAGITAIHILHAAAGGKVGIGMTNPEAKLSVTGNVYVEGGSAEISFADRAYTGGLNASSAAGQRWTWYSSGGTARLWTPGLSDVLQVNSAGCFGINVVPSNSYRLYVVGDSLIGGNLFANGFIDARNTGYYISASTTSNLYTLQVVNGLSVVGGGLNVANNSSLSLGNATRQMVNLYNQAYGFGVQSGTLYSRTDGNFAWFLDGAHSDAAFDPGVSGGVAGALLAKLTSDGSFYTARYYDIADTGYYVWPSSISVLYNLQVNNKITTYGGIGLSMNQGAGGHYPYIEWFYGGVRGAYMGWGTAGLSGFIQLNLESQNYFAITSGTGPSWLNVKDTGLEVGDTTTSKTIKVNGAVVPSVIIDTRAPTSSDLAPYGALWLVI